MELIITIVIIVLIVKTLKKKKNSGSETGIVVPVAGSKDYKKAAKEFQYEYQRATGEYGVYACESMGKVAEAYAIGNGVEKDIEKAKYWKEKQIRAELQQRAYMSEFYGPTGYVADLRFFMDGKYIPVDLAKAEELA